MAATAAVAAAAVADPHAAFMAGTAVAATGGALCKAPAKIRGRAWLSMAERRQIGAWGAGSAVWAGGLGLDLWGTDTAGFGLLAAATAPSAWAWASSRWAPRKPLSKRARQFVGEWPQRVAAVAGPLHGSTIVANSVAEPMPGTVVLMAQLRDVHSATATGTETAQLIERVYNLGVNTVTVEKVLEHSGRVMVTIAAERHLQTVAADWPGPILLDDGRVPIAITQDGRDVHISLYNESGVEHALIFGATGTGKSNTLAALLLPGVAAGIETLWYIDGGGGGSLPHLRGAADWWAIEGPDEWLTLLDAARAVLRARKTRRAQAGIGEWRGRAETDPILTVCVDEATTVMHRCSKSQLARAEDVIGEIGREGRKLGVRIVQATQDPVSSAIIGGRQTRGQLGGGGSVLSHRAGDGTAALLSATSTAEKIDLRALPPGPGWAGIIHKGTIAAPVARVRFASKEKTLKAIADITTLRTLDGADADAASAAYTDRVPGRLKVEPVPAAAPPQTSTTPGAASSAPVVVPPSDTTTAPSDTTTNDGDEAPALAAPLQALGIATVKTSAAVGDLCRVRILHALADGPMTAARIIAELGMSKSAVYRYLDELTRDGTITKNRTDYTLTKKTDSSENAA